MSTLTKNLTVAVTALTCAALAYASSVGAAQTVPRSLTQQGVLLDSTNTPVDAVALQFKFALYTTPTGTVSIWTETQSITPDKGYFSARLGEATPFPSTIFDGSQTVLYLGITIGSDSEMAPRQQLTSVPFAMLSLNAVSATHADSATNADSASTATGALNTRIAALESCPGDATAPGKWGFCLWLDSNGLPASSANYNFNFGQAAGLCKAKGARLCTLGEMNAAQAAGFNSCAYGWVADRPLNDFANGYRVVPLSTTAGCGFNVGVNAELYPIAGNQAFAYCCKP